MHKLLCTQPSFCKNNFNLNILVSSGDYLAKSLMYQDEAKINSSNRVFTYVAPHSGGPSGILITLTHTPPLPRRACVHSFKTLPNSNFKRLKLPALHHDLRHSSFKNKLLLYF